MIKKEDKKTVIVAHFDGSCEPCNPGGSMGMGIHFQVNDKPVRKYGHKEPPAPDNTNNVAEYKALEWLLNTLILEKISDADIHIKGDSKLVIMQMRGLWRIKAGAYKPFAHRCQRLIAELDMGNHVFLEWVPREQNQLADEMCK